MRTAAEWDATIASLRSGDDDALAEFFERYASSLARVAERQIAPRLRRRFGPETVVQSACCSFLLRARDGRFELPDSESLWRLLCAITLRKVREKARYHERDRRGVQQEQHPSAEGGGAFEGAATDSTDPSEALVIAEEFEALLSGLDEEERKIVELKLQEHSTAEVAEALGCSERTVRRLTSSLRQRLEEAFAAA